MIKSGYIISYHIVSYLIVSCRAAPRRAAPRRTAQYQIQEWHSSKSHQSCLRDTFANVHFLNCTRTLAFCKSLTFFNVKYDIRQMDSRIQGFKNIYLTKKIHASWQQPLDFSFYEIKTNFIQHTLRQALWTLIGQLHMEGQSTLHFINAFRKDKFATSGDPY